MNKATNPWFAARTFLYSDSKLPKPIRKQILKDIKKLDFTKSLTASDEGDQIRTSTNSWLFTDTWIAGILHNIMVRCNEYYCYDLVHFDDQIQVTKYDELQQYGWHIDQAEMKSTDHLPRKLSITLLLNDDFEGGELEIYNPVDQKTMPVPMKAGSYCVFPSWVAHRVKPVTKGTRYSLVAWMNGPQFR